jgi:hypothetical protein
MSGQLQENRIPIRVLSRTQRLPGHQGNIGVMNMNVRQANVAPCTPPAGGVSPPEDSNFNFEWRRALRSKHFDWQRERICELRASKRTRQSASKPPMRSTISGVLEITELKAREAWLGLHKIALKTRRAFK